MPPALPRISRLAKASDRDLHRSILTLTSSIPQEMSSHSGRAPARTGQKQATSSKTRTARPPQPRLRPPLKMPATMKGRLIRLVNRRKLDDPSLPLNWGLSEYIREVLAAHLDALPAEGEGDRAATEAPPLRKP
jgi:hypothetical protein